MGNQMINPSSKVRAQVLTEKITVVDFIKISIVELRKTLSTNRIGSDYEICGSAMIFQKNGWKKFLFQISRLLPTDTIYGFALILRGFIRYRNGQLQGEMALMQASTIPHPRDSCSP